MYIYIVKFHKRHADCFYVGVVDSILFIRFVCAHHIYVSGFSVRVCVCMCERTFPGTECSHSTRTPNESVYVVYIKANFVMRLSRVVCLRTFQFATALFVF